MSPLGRDRLARNTDRIPNTMTSTLAAVRPSALDPERLLDAARDVARAIRSGEAGEDYARAERLAGMLSLAYAGSSGRRDREALAAALRTYATTMPRDPERAVAGLTRTCESLRIAASANGPGPDGQDALAVGGALPGLVMAHAHLVAVQIGIQDQAEPIDAAAAGQHLEMADRYHASGVADADAELLDGGLRTERDSVAEYLDAVAIAAMLANGADAYPLLSGRVSAAKAATMRTILTLRADGA